MTNTGEQDLPSRTLNQLKDKNLWKGLNKLGNILKYVRVVLKKIVPNTC